MASGIPLSSLANGVEWLVAPSNFLQPGATRSVYVYLRGTTTQVSVYSTQALTGSPMTQPLTTLSTGGVPGYIAAEQQIDFFDALTSTRAQAEPFSVADLIGTSGKIGDTGSLGLPSSVVSRSSGATYGSVLGLKEFYIEDYVSGTGLVPGSGGYVPGVGDDTAALQAVIDYLATNNVTNSVIRLPSSLNLNSNPRTDRQGNAIVALPTHGGSSMGLIYFKGAQGGTNITSTVTGQSYSSSFGPPSVIGGPTTEQLGQNTNFSRAQIYMTDVAIFVPANPTICCLDLSRVPAVFLDRVIVKSGSPTTQPTSMYTFGIHFPEGDNSGDVVAGQLTAQGMYAGIVANSHFTAEFIFTSFCMVGMAWTGNTQINTNDGHSAAIKRLLTQECANHVGGWSPTSGPASIPSGHQIQFVILEHDIEDGAAANWYTTAEHYLDANSQMYGDVKYARVVGGVGPVGGPLTLSGALNLKLVDQCAPGYLHTPKFLSVFGDGSDGAATLDGTATVAWASKAGSVYTMTRDCFCTTLVVNSGVTVNTSGYRIFATTSVANSGTVQCTGATGAAAGTGGAGGTVGFFGAGATGGAGNTGAGTAGGGSVCFGGTTSGAGGAGSGGAGGAGTSPTGAGLSYVYRDALVALTATTGFGGTVRGLSGATGGGGGGGDGTNHGGGGGGGGGMMGFFTPLLVNQSGATISVAGGAGGTPTAGNCGGGGGGSGGLLLAYTLTAWQQNGTITTSGGTAGSGVGTGVAGGAGGAGFSNNYVLV